MMKARLVSAGPGVPRSSVSLTEFPVVIGRSAEAGLQLSDCWVSRRHCEIDVVGGTLVVRDLNSRHGTFVNGHSVREAHLLPGDRLTVGMTSLLAEYKRNSSPRTRRAETAGPGV